MKLAVAEGLTAYEESFFLIRSELIQLKTQNPLRPRKAYCSSAEILSFHKLDLSDIMALPPTQNGNLMVPVPENLRE